MAKIQHVSICVLRITQPMTLPQARLQDEHIIVFGRVNHDFIVRVYSLPSSFRRGRYGCTQDWSHFSPASRDTDAETEEVGWGPVLKQLQLPLGMGLVDSIFVPSHFTSSLALFIVDNMPLLEPGPVGRLLRFCLDDKRDPRTPAVHSARVALPSDTSVRLVGIGATGRRAVWMENSLETTRSRLMKMELGETSDGTLEAFRGVLLPSDPPLPFSMDACHMLAFDEATCRLCLGLWDGSLHVVDFS